MENNYMEDNEEIDFKNDNKYFNDSVIFVVQVCDKLFNKIEGEENSDTFYNMIIKCYEQFLKVKIISNPNDLVGFIFYDANNTKNILEFVNIVEFQNLCKTSAKIIKNTDDWFSNLPKIGNKSNFEEVIFLCAELFKKGELKNYTKRIFLFTEEEIPKDIDEKKIMHNIKELDIELNLFPLINENEIFDVTKFYDKLINFDKDEVNLNLTKNKFKDLFKEFKKKQIKKRILTKGELTLGPGCDIAIKYYTLINKTKKPIPIKLIKKNNNNVQNKITKFMLKNGDDEILLEDLGRFISLGHEKVIITKEEIEKIKCLEKPQLTLLGFKDKTKLKPYHSLRNSLFLYPDDDRIINSSKTFNGLINEMGEKIAICKYSSNRSKTMRMVALYPQEELVKEGKYINPPGFHMIFLPFKEDIREHNHNLKNDKNTLPRKEKEYFKYAKNLVKSLTKDFNIDDFQNPEIQKFYSFLQTLALDSKNLNFDDNFYKLDEKLVKNANKDIKLFNYNYNLDSDLEISSEDDNSTKIEIKKVNI